MLFEFSYRILGIVQNLSHFLCVSTFQGRGWLCLHNKCSAVFIYSSLFKLFPPPSEERKTGFYFLLVSFHFLSFSCPSVFYICCWVVGYWAETDHIWAVAAGHLEKNWSPFPGDQKREEIKRKNEKIIQMF